MSNSEYRSFIPALNDQIVVSACIFSDELNAHGIVLSLDDGSEISLEFDLDTRLISKVFRCNGEDDAVLLDTLPALPNR